MVSSPFAAILNRCRLRPIGAAVRWGLLSLSLTVVGVAHAADAPVVWLSGPALAKAHDQPITIVQERAEVRDLLRRLAEVRQSACLLDRRIDPASRVTLQLQQVPLREVFEQTASQVGARCGMIGGTLLIGEESRLDRLLSQSEALQSETKTNQSIPANRRLQLFRRQNLHWNDLDQPVDLLTRIEQSWGQDISNKQQIPHDRWAAGSVANVDALEALLLVLGQFDLSVRWTLPGTQVEIIPLPERIEVERTHRPQGVTAAKASLQIKERHPTATVTVRGPTLVVRATALEQAAIARELAGDRGGPAATTPVPLSRRRFPVKVVRSPASAVLKTLQAQGVTIMYDADRLSAAGVDLDRLVSLEFTNATADEFFTALCSQLALSYSIEGATVTLMPR